MPAAGEPPGRSPPLPRRRGGPALREDSQAPGHPGGPPARGLGSAPDCDAAALTGEPDSEHRPGGGAPGTRGPGAGSREARDSRLRAAERPRARGASVWTAAAAALSDPDLGWHSPRETPARDRRHRAYAASRRSTRRLVDGTRRSHRPPGIAPRIPAQGANSRANATPPGHPGHPHPASPAGPHTSGVTTPMKGRHGAGRGVTATVTGP